jgi:hypothetical protein
MLRITSPIRIVSEPAMYVRLDKLAQASKIKFLNHSLEGSKEISLPLSSLSLRRYW